MVWEVKFYQNSRGEEPVKVFILTLETRVRTKVSDAIQLLKESGPFMMPPYMKKLKQNLYELRVKSKVAVRVFYSPKTGKYYLLHAFIKKTQKTPERELKIAVEEKGMTQASIAKKMGTTQSSIARVEAGKSHPTIPFMQRLAEALDMRLEIRFLPK